VLGAIKVTSHGPQNHFFDWDKLKSLYQQAYGDPWPL